jgi:hypothetical protein
MSNRPCNLCDFNERKRRAQREHKKLKLVNDDGWRRVMVAEVGTDEWKDGEVLYMQVPSTCEC